MSDVLPSLVDVINTNTRFVARFQDGSILLFDNYTIVGMIRIRGDVIELSMTDHGLPLVGYSDQKLITMLDEACADGCLDKENGAFVRFIREMGTAVRKMGKIW